MARLGIFILVTLFAGVLAGEATAEPIENVAIRYSDNVALCGPLPQSDGRELKSRALLVGINEYSDVGIPDLAGAVNDVCLIRRILVMQRGFSDSEILILVNSAATRQAILTALSRDLSSASPSNLRTLFFYYAGHGSQLTDDDGDEAGFDGLDETILPYDAKLSLRDDIRDDELTPIFKHLAAEANSITVMFDSCNSGTALRSSVRPRRVERDEEPQTKIVSGDTQQLLDDLFAEQTNLTFLSAAAERELANETVKRGRSHGAFTYAFARSMRTSSSDATGRELIDRARVYLQREEVLGQTPTIEGANADAVFLGTGREHSLPYLQAVPTSEVAHSRIFRISSGDISGETIGSKYEIITGSVKGQVHLATVKHVGPYESEIELNSGMLPAEIYRVKKVSHAYAAAPPKVFVAGSLKRLSEQIRSSESKFKIKRSIIGADYAVSGDSDSGPYHVETSSGRLLASVQRPDQVLDTISYWERWKRFRNIDDERGEPLVMASLGGSPCGLLDRYIPTKRKFQVCVEEDGEEPRLQIQNATNISVWVNFIAINPSGSIAQLGEPRQLEPNTIFTSPGLGIRAKSGAPETTIIKVFASENRVDLSAFQQTSQRSDAVTCTSENLDALNHILCLANGTRSDIVNASTGNWSVSDLAITVSPNP